MEVGDHTGKMINMFFGEQLLSKHPVKLHCSVKSHHLNGIINNHAFGVNKKCISSADDRHDRKVDFLTQSLVEAKLLVAVVMALFKS